MYSENCQCSETADSRQNNTLVKVHESKYRQLETIKLQIKNRKSF